MEVVLVATAWVLRLEAWWAVVMATVESAISVSLRNEPRRTVAGVLILRLRTKLRSVPVAMMSTGDAGTHDQSDAGNDTNFCQPSENVCRHDSFQ